MSYQLNALIASSDLIHAIAGELPAAHVAALAQGFSLIPVTEPLFDALNAGNEPCPLGFTSFPNGLLRRLEAWSRVWVATGIQRIGRARRDRHCSGAMPSGCREIRCGDRDPLPVICESTRIDFERSDNPGAIADWQSHARRHLAF